jgi:hypothetical protein
MPNVNMLTCSVNDGICTGGSISDFQNVNYFKAFLILLILSRQISASSGHNNFPSSTLLTIHTTIWSYMEWVIK